MAGITTLTGGAIARCEETGRYSPAGGGSGDGSLPAGAGCRTELMVWSLSSGGPPAPGAVRLCLRFERGVLIHGTTAWISVPAR
ncbi:hypothetical protein GCM10010424_31140 [Streptomyces lienomycini]